MAAQGSVRLLIFLKAALSNTPAAHCVIPTEKNISSTLGESAVYDLSNTPHFMMSVP
jgi:hypothetical protein